MENNTGSPSNQWDDLLIKISDANISFDKFLADNALLFTNVFIGALLVTGFQLIVGGWFWPFILSGMCIGLRFIRKPNPPSNGRTNAL